MVCGRGGCSLYRGKLAYVYIFIIKSVLINIDSSTHTKIEMRVVGRKSGKLSRKFPHHPTTQTQSNSTSPEKLRDTHIEREREIHPAAMSHVPHPEREREHRESSSRAENTQTKKSVSNFKDPKAVSLFSHRDKKCQV